MSATYIQDEAFNKEDFTQVSLAKGNYEECLFSNCNFSDCDLSGFSFSNCEFSDCNLSLAKLEKTALQDITFNNSKMLGLQFDRCNQFGIALSFTNCVLNHSVFYKTKIKKTFFINCQLQEADFTECDLNNSVFDNCDLTGATFEYTNLEKADFRSSWGYSINPENNRIKKARFTLSGLAGLLEKYDIDISQ